MKKTPPFHSAGLYSCSPFRSFLSPDTRQAVSKHIKVLTECQLLEQKKVGWEIYYHFNPAKMKEIDNWLTQFRTLWEKQPGA